MVVYILRYYISVKLLQFALKKLLHFAAYQIKGERTINSLSPKEFEPDSVNTFWARRV